MINKDSKIYIAGHTGVIGSAIYKKLTKEGYTNIIVRRHQELDLMDEKAVDSFFEKEKPEYVFYCAGRDGTAEYFKNHSADVFRHHITMQSNVIYSSFVYGVKRLLYTASGACYGSEEKSPFSEEKAINSIQKGPIQSYSLAKIAGIVMCQAYNNQYECDFRSVLPCHLFSYNNLLKEESNILEDIIKKICQAKKDNKEFCHLNIWGKGQSRTKYIFQDDCADAFVFIMNSDDKVEVINVCPEESYSLSEIAFFVKEKVKYDENLIFEEDKEERKNDRFMSCEKITKLGFKPKFSVLDRIAELVGFYIDKISEAKNV